jgi:NAD-dependent SIR2 family protein deacetylase
MVVITGAGISTNSGIPDYRGPQGSYRVGHKPITHQEFVGDFNYRKRYWARSIMGWEVFSKANPNDAHYSLKQLEDFNKIQTIVTQNVDRLHQRAGSKRVVDLHGRNDLVVCLQCKHQLPRDAFQKDLVASNSVFYNYLRNKMKSFKEEQERKYSGQNETEKNLNLLMRADGDMELGITDFSEVSNSLYCIYCAMSLIELCNSFIYRNVLVVIRN